MQGIVPWPIHRWLAAATVAPRVGNFEGVSRDSEFAHPSAILPLAFPTLRAAVPVRAAAPCPQSPTRIPYMRDNHSPTLLLESAWDLKW
jgi:hypothetical protein